MNTGEEERAPILFNAVALLISVSAGAIAFLPLALYTSPWDCVRFRVPDNQGNWWHFLIGVPFFLAFPMIWLRLRSLFSERLSTPAGRRLIWAILALSICGTISVELPFLLRLGNLARMNEWRQLSVLCPTFGIVIVSGALLFLRRRDIVPTRACLVGLNAAYLANAALCLVVYGPMPGTAGSRSGWIVAMVIVWPMMLELVWIFIRSFRTSAVARGKASKLHFREALLDFGMVCGDTGEVPSLTVHFDSPCWSLPGYAGPAAALPCAPLRRAIAAAGTALPLPGVGCSVTPAALRRRRVGEQRRASFDDRSLWGFASCFLGTNFCSVSYNG